MHRKSTARLAAVAVLGLALAGCSSKKRFEVPPYPGSSQTGSNPNETVEGGTIVRTVRTTSDPGVTVADWYRQELVQKLGWQEKKGLGPTFTDGNVEVTWQLAGPGDVKVLDATRPGAQVLIYEVSRTTYVRGWTYLPKE